MSNFGLYLAIGFMGIVGGLSSLYIVIGLPAYFVWKVLRKLKNGGRLSD